MSDLLQFVAKKDYSSFRKEYNQVFEQKFDELASEIEKDAIAELSLYPVNEARKIKVKPIGKLDEWSWKSIVNLMDDRIREKVDSEYSFDDDIEFLEKYLEFDPEFVNVLKQEFSRDVKVFESKRTMKKVKENEDEFELVSIEAPEDEKSIIIKYELNGEKGEKILDEEDDIEYYKEIVSDTDDLTGEQMDKIKSDCLESKKRK